MICVCKNPDGIPSEFCLGTCKQQDGFLQGNALEQRCQLEMEDRFEVILKNHLERIDERIRTLERLAETKFRQGFKEGFEMAKEIYE